MNLEFLPQKSPFTQCVHVSLRAGHLPNFFFLCVFEAKNETLKKQRLCNFFIDKNFFSDRKKMFLLLDSLLPQTCLQTLGSQQPNKPSKHKFIFKKCNQKWSPTCDIIFVAFFKLCKNFLLTFFKVCKPGKFTFCCAPSTFCLDATRFLCFPVFFLLWLKF